MFDPLIPGVVEQSKNHVPADQPEAASKDLNEVAANVCATNLRAPDRTCGRDGEALRRRFHRAGAQGMLAFYKSPLGKKLIDREPRYSSMTHERCTKDWARTSSREEVIAKLRAEMKKRGHNL